MKLTFAQGAKLPDPAKLFDAGLAGNERRAVDIFETDAINKKALKNLLRAAVAFNQAKMVERRGAAPKKAPKSAPRILRSPASSNPDRSRVENRRPYPGRECGPVDLPSTSP